MIDAILPDIAVEKPASSLQAPSKEFQEALLAGLARTDSHPVPVPYDEAGSALFDLICTCPNIIQPAPKSPSCGIMPMTWRNASARKHV
jgi:hypothetical protein